MKVRIAFIVLLAGVMAAALAAPYVYAEYRALHHSGLVIVGPKPTATVSGRWFDDYFVIENIEADTYGIGEPRYYQANYSYLILGTQRAVLFDSGSGNRNIVPVVRSLTQLPVTVIPSHLHFDHVGGLGGFDRTALIDDPDLRARAHDGLLQLERYEFLGFVDGLPAPRVRVDEWWPAGAIIDLGGRSLEVLSTPGHTPTSVSLYDAQHRQLFCGDFVYPGLLYAFSPGSSRSAYRRTTEQLLAKLDPATQLFTAHPPDGTALIAAPRLTVPDLQALLKALRGIEAGSVRSTGFYPRIFPVNESMRFGTGFAWNNR